MDQVSEKPGPLSNSEPISSWYTFVHNQNCVFFWSFNFILKFAGNFSISVASDSEAKSTSSIYSPSVIQTVACFLLKCLHARLLCNETDALLMLSSTWFGAQFASHVPILCSLALEFLRDPARIGNLSLLQQISRLRCMRLSEFLQRRPSYAFILAHAPSDERGFIYELSDGQLKCCLLGTACIESDLDLESCAQLLSKIQTRAFGGWCSSSKLEVFEFLCGDVVKTNIRLFETIDVKKVLLLWRPKFVEKVKLSCIFWLLIRVSHFTSNFVLQEIFQQIELDRMIAGQISSERKLLMMVLACVLVEQLIAGQPIAVLSSETGVDSFSIQKLFQSCSIHAAKVIRFLSCIRAENFSVFVNSEFGNSLAAGCVAAARSLLPIMSGQVAACFFHAGVSSVATVAAMTPGQIRALVSHAFAFVPASDPQFESLQQQIDETMSNIIVRAKALTEASETALLSRRPKRSLQESSEARSSISASSWEELLRTANSDLSHLQEGGCYLALL